MVMLFNSGLLQSVSQSSMGAFGEASSLALSNADTATGANDITSAVHDPIKIAEVPIKSVNFLNIDICKTLSREIVFGILTSVIYACEFYYF